MQNSWTRFVLSVTDVQSTLDYYVHTLGWNDPWLFGEPPNFAGCYGFSELEMRLVEEPGDVNGYPLHITADDIEALAAGHREKGVQFVKNLGLQSWEEFGYVIKDLNGYHLRFTKRVADAPHESANLVVRDLARSLAYYQDILGFADVHIWREQFARLEHPTRLEFWENEELANRAPQHMISIYGDGVDESYERHMSNGVDLVDGLEAKPWGIKQYVIEDPDGYFLRFGEEHEPDDNAFDGMRLPDEPTSHGDC